MCLQTLSFLQDDHFRNVPDLVRLAKKFQRGKGNLQDVVRFHDVVVKLPRLLGDLLLVKDGAAQAGLSDLLQERYVGPLEVSWRVA